MHSEAPIIAMVASVALLVRLHSHGMSCAPMHIQHHVASVRESTSPSRMVCRRINSLILFVYLLYI